MKIAGNNYYNKNLSFYPAFGQSKMKQNEQVRQNQINPLLNSKKDDYEDIAYKYEESASEICDFAYAQKQKAQEVLREAVEIMDKCNITGNNRLDKKIPDENGNIRAKFTSHCCGSKSNGTKVGVDYIFDTTLREYDKDGNLKRSIEFSRLPSDNENNYAVRQKFTDAPFVKSIKEYDENGMLKRNIKGDFKAVSKVRAIELFDNKDNKTRVNFSNGKLLSFQRGEFTMEGDFMKCPDIFEFEDDKLSMVKRNLVYYGAHVANCEIYKYDNGSFIEYKEV